MTQLTIFPYTFDLVKIGQLQAEFERSRKEWEKEKARMQEEIKQKNRVIGALTKKK
jgi:hypothetical protein